MSQGLRIAVADDEADIREFLQRMLAAMGHSVVCVADNGRQLVEQCRVCRPDLVITDVKMPELDGLQAAREICRELHIPIILITALPGAQQDCSEMACIVAQLVKPIGRKDLEPAIALAMRLGVGLDGEL